MLNVFEGDRQTCPAIHRRVSEIYRRHGGFALGAEPGRSFERGKYDFPYLRDWVMDRNIMADVSETATVWSNLLPLYRSTRDAPSRAAIRRTGVKPYVGCHVSHAYRTGASLYFTFGCLQRAEPGTGAVPLHQEERRRTRSSRGGATLSHHHAVGTEHLPWITDDISPAGARRGASAQGGPRSAGDHEPGKDPASRTPARGVGTRRAGDRVRSRREFRLGVRRQGRGCYRRLVRPRSGAGDRAGEPEARSCPGRTIGDGAGGDREPVSAGGRCPLIVPGDLTDPGLRGS